MPDFFKVGKAPVFIGATTDDPKTINKNSGGKLYCATDREDILFSEAEVVVGIPLTATKGHWFISADSTNVMVEDAST